MNLTSRGPLITPNNRKLILTTHIVMAVGWLGAVAAFLALSITAYVSHDPELIRGNYVAMYEIGGFVIVPFCLATLATGLFQALGSQWGLFKHYWITLKFGLATVATFALLTHQLGPVSEAARRVTGATTDTLLGPSLDSLKFELLRAPALAILLLLTTAALGVFKPWGLTAYGRKKQQEKLKLPEDPKAKTPIGLKIFLTVIGALLVILVIIHMAGHGFHH